ncbi:MAG: hypothetical protein CL608_09055 [Anaerolineaceae bacterium]|nr:hypothetical protein [Anaerolineaceae bacterium]
MINNNANAVNRYHNTGSTNHTKLILLCVVTAIIVTIFHIQLASFIFEDGFNFWDSGSPSYGAVARSLYEQNMLSLDQETPTAYRPPLYPIFLAVLLQISSQPQSIIIAQSILAGVTFGLLTAIAYSYTHRSWPTLLMLFLFVAIKFIAFDNIIQHETVLFTTLLCIGAILFISETMVHSAKKVIGLGFVLGLAALVRPLAPVVVSVLLLWLGWLFLNRVPIVDALGKVILCIGVFFLTLLPWGLRNWFSIGTFTLTSTTTGLNLWKGNNPATADIYPELDIDTYRLLFNEIPEESGWWDDLRILPQLSEAEENRYLFGLGKQYILEKPVHFLKMGSVKLWALWTPKNIPIYQGNVKWTSTGAEISNLRPFYDDLLPTLILYLLAIPGIWQRRHSPYVFYLIAWAVAFSAIHFLTFAESRFRWPINMLMLPMAAVGLHLIVGKIGVAFKQFKISGS